MEIKLVEIKKEHLPFLFKWRNETNFLNNCSHRNRINSILDFDNELKNDFLRDRHFQFIILYKNIPVGTIYSYSYNGRDKFLFITTFITDEFTKKSIGIKAFLIFSEFLFNKFKLFKIYIDVYAYNKEMLSVLEKSLFSIEGVFLNQHLHKGKRYNVIRFSVYEKDILHWAKKIKTTTANIFYIG